MLRYVRGYVPVMRYVFSGVRAGHVAGMDRREIWGADAWIAWNLEVCLVSKGIQSKRESTMRFKMADRKSEIRCYRCGKKVRDGGVGDFNLELKYVTFCSPGCRSLFWQKDKGLHKPIQKQESLWAFAIPQFGWAGANVMEIWRTTFAGYTHLPSTILISSSVSP